MVRANRKAAGLAALAAASALGFAFLLEYAVGLVPCALCLWERWPYRVAITLGVAGVLLPRLARPLLWLILLAVLADVALAAVHVGVENGLWPSPLPQCMAPHLTGSVTDRLAALPALPAKPCEDPVYLIEAIPVSLALANLLFALAFAASLAMFLSRRGRRRL